MASSCYPASSVADFLRQAEDHLMLVGAAREGRGEVQTQPQGVTANAASCADGEQVGEHALEESWTDAREQLDVQARSLFAMERRLRRLEGRVEASGGSAPASPFLRALRQPEAAADVAGALSIQQRRAVQHCPKAWENGEDSQGDASLEQYLIGLHKAEHVRVDNVLRTLEERETVMEETLEHLLHKDFLRGEDLRELQARVAGLVDQDRSAASALAVAGGGGGQMQCGGSSGSRCPCWQKTEVLQDSTAVLEKEVRQLQLRLEDFLKKQGLVESWAADHRELCEALRGLAAAQKQGETQKKELALRVAALEERRTAQPGQREERGNTCGTAEQEEKLSLLEERLDRLSESVVRDVEIAELRRKLSSIEDRLAALAAELHRHGSMSDVEVAELRIGLEAIQDRLLNAPSGDSSGGRETNAAVTELRRGLGAVEDRLAALVARDETRREAAGQTAVAELQRGLAAVEEQLSAVAAELLESRKAGAELAELRLRLEALDAAMSQCGAAASPLQDDERLLQQILRNTEQAAGEESAPAKDGLAASHRTSEDAEASGGGGIEERLAALVALRLRQRQCDETDDLEGRLQARLSDMQLSLEAVADKVARAAAATAVRDGEEHFVALLQVQRQQVTTAVRELEERVSNVFCGSGGPLSPAGSRHWQRTTKTSGSSLDATAEAPGGDRLLASALQGSDVTMDVTRLQAELRTPADSSSSCNGRVEAGACASWQMPSAPSETSAGKPTVPHDDIDAAEHARLEKLIEEQRRYANEQLQMRGSDQQQQFPGAAHAHQRPEDGRPSTLLPGSPGSSSSEDDVPLFPARQPLRQAAPFIHVAEPAAAAAATELPGAAARGTGSPRPVSPDGRNQSLRLPAGVSLARSETPAVVIAAKGLLSPSRMSRSPSASPSRRSSKALPVTSRSRTPSSARSLQQAGIFVAASGAEAPSPAAAPAPAGSEVASWQATADALFRRSRDETPRALGPADNDAPPACSPVVRQSSGTPSLHRWLSSRSPSPETTPTPLHARHEAAAFSLDGRP
eukprot:TRINITY_DN29896_c0_g1_i6.p1 TRINITY_DN29896_c0_g1~~TRINITY_DN29896_c0_g1_i6.p1  ORF type:complete len:1033 (-),score=271.44 TRINITY_DN29896_c0_g1_i6:85-3183(-)